MITRQPNVLFIMTDHQRADSLGMVQAGVEVCPNLNRLASRGVVFERAYSTCPLCVPARTALATAKYPTTNGVIVNDWEGETAQDHATLHELLHRSGYDVAHIGVHHIRVCPDLEKRVPFARWVGAGEYNAFHASIAPGERNDTGLFSNPVQENQGGERRHRRYSNTHVGTWPGDAENFKDLWWCREAVDFVRQNRSQPFALFLYLWAPHPPLRVPEPYASRFDPRRIELPENIGRPCEGEPSGYRSGAPAQLAEGVTPDDWRRVWAAHLGLVNLADTGIGRVLDAIHGLGHQDETLTLFTTDHGDHLGQHGMYQKMEMYDQALRVPLIFAGPGIAVRSADVLVSHLDVMPSLLDLIGIGTPDDLDGISLAWTLCRRAQPQQRPIFAQYSGNSVVGDIRRCVISERYKYIWSPPDGRELYDLEADPLEMSNLAESVEHQAMVRRLHEECRQWGTEHSDPVFT